MPTPSEHKTVQARILKYAEAICWTFVSREEAEQRRGFDPNAPPADRAKNRSLFFNDLLDAKVGEFNSRYADAEGTLISQFHHLHADIKGNQDFVEHLRNRGKFFDQEEGRERDLTLIDYDGEQRLRSYRGVGAIRTGLWTSCPDGGSLPAGNPGIRTEIRTLCPNTAFPPSGSRHKSRHHVAIPGNSQIFNPNPAEP